MLRALFPREALSGKTDKEISMRRLFGTDGIRGIAGRELTASLTMKIGSAAGRVLSEDCRYKIRAIIGCDTRSSCDMLVAALKAGLYSAGADVIDIGIAPTPAVAYLVKRNNAELGIVVSASHNPYEYNGIKVFGRDGFKIPDEIEERIEGLALGDTADGLAPPESFGRAVICDFGLRDYKEHLKSAAGDLSGIRAVIDCANGAASVSSDVFSELLDDPIFIGKAPDGLNINKDCGSTSLHLLREKVKECGADIGIAFDGDGDRCLAIDERGREIDGDFIMAIMAKRLKMQGKLYKNSVVGTVMTNLGFIKFCENEGINYYSAKVGDRYVLEMMEQEGFVLGGEQSGHIILRDMATTGDGQLSALVLLSIMKKCGKPLSELASVMKKYPQYSGSIDADNDSKIAFRIDRDIRQIIEKYEKKNPEGRLVVRPSGTEPLIRIMAEGEDMGIIKEIVDGVKGELSERLAAIRSRTVS